MNFLFPDLMYYLDISNYFLYKEQELRVTSYRMALMHTMRIIDDIVC